jgi:hypothetical protein
VRNRAALGLVACVAALSVSCETLISDAATRVAYAVRDGAARLRSSGSDSLVLSVAWRSWPDGCPGGYRLKWDGDEEKSPGIGVTCTTGKGRFFSTTYYRRFVTVPRTLEATKAQGEPATIALRKQADGSIAVVALQ